MLPLTRVKSYFQVRQDIKCSVKSKQCGNACIPKVYKCRLTSQQLNAFIERVENQIKDLNYEKAIALNPTNGTVLFSKGGDTTSVYLSPKNLQQIRGAVITHNHPNLGWSKNDARSKGLSFSASDIELACRANVAEIRAVSSNYRHSLKPPPTGWNKEYWQTQLSPTYQKYEKQVYTQYVTQILTGFKKVDQAEADYHHEVIQRTANQLGMNYLRTQIN